MLKKDEFQIFSFRGGGGSTETPLIYIDIKDIIFFPIFMRNHPIPSIVGRILRRFLKKIGFGEGRTGSIGFGAAERMLRNKNIIRSVILDFLQYAFTTTHTSPYTLHCLKRKNRRNV